MKACYKLSIPINNSFFPYFPHKYQRKLYFHRAHHTYCLINLIINTIQFIGNDLQCEVITVTASNLQNLIPMSVSERSVHHALFYIYTHVTTRQSYLSIC